MKQVGLRRIKTQQKFIFCVQIPSGLTTARVPSIIRTSAMATGRDDVQIKNQILATRKRTETKFNLPSISLGSMATIAKRPAIITKPIPARMPSVCTKCGTSKQTSKPSCCSYGGSWYNNCGDAGDSNFDHTWTEGVQACKNGIASAQADTCIFGFSECLSAHYDFDAEEKKLTHPKAMQRNDDGNLQGSCVTAIWNGVEGKLCCTTGMQQLAACLPTKVGDYRLCEHSWNTVYGPKFYDKAKAIMLAFTTGGYCVSPDVVSTCAKCGMNHKTGERNCCAPGGAWYLNCGTGDPHSWPEGSLACKHKRAYTSLSVGCFVF